MTTLTVAWRQHRIAVACLLAVLAIYVVSFAIGTHSVHVYAAGHGYALSCAASIWAGCGLGASLGAVAYWSLLVLPVLVGVLVGAPLVARDFETQAFRFAATQGVRQRRQVTARLLFLGVVVAVVTCSLALLAIPWSTPLARSGYVERWLDGSFYLTPVILPALSLLALTVGVMMGAAIKRTVAAMAATLAAGAVGSALLFRLTKLLLTVAPASNRSVPEFQGNIGGGFTQWEGYPSGWPGPHGAVLVGGWFTGPHGQRLSTGAVATLLKQLPVRHGDQGGPAVQVRTWLAARHVTYWTAYQPAGRYWLFQAAVGVIILAVAVAAGYAAVRLAGRRG